MKRWSVGLSCLVLGVAAGVFVAGPILRGQPRTPEAPPVPREPVSYRDVAKKVLPAVVSVEGKSAAPSRPERETGRGPREEARPLDLGSGVLIDPRGVIVTSYHVVDGADRVEVTLGDGRKFISKDVKADPKSDIAVVRIESKEALPFVELGDSDAMEIGDRVLAFGAPFGLTGSVTAGIVSAKSRSLRINQYEDFIQTDAAINPGNSGGPLVNLEGKVIGINAAIKSRSGGFQGVGLAIASNLVATVTEQLLRDGVVRRGYLGVQIKEVESAEVAARLGLDRQHGVIVTHLYEGAPAVRGGVKAGDVILSINGKPLADSRALQRVVVGLPVGKPAEVAVMRDGKPATLRVVIEEQPDQFGTARVPLPRDPEGAPGTVRVAAAGIDAADLTPDFASALGYREGAKGALVVRVQPGGPAAQSGLRSGMLITRVEKQTVASASALVEALKGAPLDKGVLLQVQSPQGGTNFVVLRAGE
jgi:serine protease Do